MQQKSPFLNQRKISSNLRCIVTPNPATLSEEAQAVVEILRGYLARAETGEINGVCLVVSNENHSYDVDCAGRYETLPIDAIGPLAVLQLKITRKALDEH